MEVRSARTRVSATSSAGGARQSCRMRHEDLPAAIDAVLDEAVASGAELSIQVAVIHDGHTLVDAVRGVVDPGTGAKVDHGTLFWAASTAKGVASTVAHTLIEHGDLSDDLRVVEVWPEFGAHGKRDVTLRHVLEHSAGVPFLPADISAADLCDCEHMCSVIADSRLAWPPGTRFGYHAKTFGFLLGEVVRRATGETISTLLRERVTGPLGVADEVHFGVPASSLPRVARQVAATGAAPPPPQSGSPAARAMPRGVRPDADYANRTDVLTSDIPSEGTM